MARPKKNVSTKKQKVNVTVKKVKGAAKKNTASKPAAKSKKATKAVKPVAKKSTKASKSIKASKTTKATKSVAKKVKKITASSKKISRLEILRILAERTALPKVQVENLFFELVNLMESHLMPKGSGEFSIPFTGVKIKRVKKKASKARKMFSPLIGEEVEIAGKSARNSVKVLALKTLKEMVEKK